MKDHDQRSKIIDHHDHKDGAWCPFCASFFPELWPNTAWARSLVGKTDGVVYLVRQSHDHHDGSSDDDDDIFAFIICINFLSGPDSSATKEKCKTSIAIFFITIFALSKLQYFVPKKRGGGGHGPFEFFSQKFVPFGGAGIPKVFNQTDVGARRTSKLRWLSVGSELLNVWAALLSFSHNRWSSPSSWDTYPQEWLCPNNSRKLYETHKWQAFTKPHMININAITGIRVNEIAFAILKGLRENWITKAMRWPIYVQVLKRQKIGGTILVVYFPRLFPLSVTTAVSASVIFERMVSRHCAGGGFLQINISISPNHRACQAPISPNHRRPVLV